MILTGSGSSLCSFSATDTSKEQFIQLHNIDPFYENNLDRKDLENDECDSILEDDDIHNDPIIFTAWTPNCCIILVVTIITES